MKVKFVPQNVEVEIETHETVFDVAVKNGIYIKTVCNGVPSCAECRVRVVEGEYNVLPPSQKEKILIGTAHFIDQRRLSCQLHCFGDITVDLSEQVEKQKTEGIKKRLKSGVVIDETKSNAKSGNLLDQDEELIKEVDKEVGESFESDEAQDKSAIELLKAETTEDDLKPGHRGRRHNNKSGGRNRNRNGGDRNQRNRHNNNGDSPRKQSADGNSEGRREAKGGDRDSQKREGQGKNRNRNRNRNNKNRNRNRGGDNRGGKGES
ncbi:MAG: 2Fe-2S iron-sulfur cluster-binding protein [Bdellovibrionales bacterium]